MVEHLQACSVMNRVGCAGAARMGWVAGQKNVNVGVAAAPDIASGRQPAAHWVNLRVRDANDARMTIESICAARAITAQR
jgi:hypothetical protein